MLEIAGYTISGAIYESSHSIVYRGRRSSDSQPVIVKLLKGSYPSRAELVRYRQEYEITRSLDLPGVVKVHGLERHESSLVMFLEDFGGTSLRSLMGAAPWALGDVLRTGATIARCLHAVHRRGVVHKDINPSNVVCNAETRELKLIDFGCATRMSGETAVLAHPSTMEGTLRYMSPEQTGRMNRAIDHRTDLYALGVTLHELLLGEPPFTAADPLELVHCHIARRPTPPAEARPDIPTPVSDILMRLLSKDAEDRYQSALGLAEDLEECLRRLGPDGRIEPFPLGRRDAPIGFQIPHKLYGRQAEIDALLSPFEHAYRRTTEPASAGQRGEAFMVAGCAGVGKSALVREILRLLTRYRGYFTGGKFDQILRNVPYSGLLMALGGLMRQLLTETEGELAAWRHRILAALGGNAQVIVELVPELELVIGKQPDVEPLSPAEAQNRLDLVFRAFLGALSAQDRPLVLFLDDLQWADAATLRLLRQALMDEELRCFFLIGAYRDNEVDPAHPLLLSMEELRRDGARIHQITLAPLGLPHVAELLSDTLRAGREEVLPLATLLLSKTGGTPFFLIELLRSFHDRQLVAFDDREGRFTWDLGRIEAVGVTDNVADLLLERLGRLPEQTRAALHLAACVGARFTLGALARVSRREPAEVFDDLGEALRAGMILPTSGVTLSPGDALSAPVLIEDFQFRHDRVQQAAYESKDPAETRRIHVEIARLLAEETPVDRPAERVFAIADHLNLGRELITGAMERDALARANLEAARCAKDAAAHAAARRYLTAGIAALPGAPWEERHDLALALHKELAEAAYLCGDLDDAERLTALVLDRARSPLEKADIHNLLLTLHSMLGRYDLGIAAAHEGLALLGTVLPSADLRAAFLGELAEVRRRLGDRPIASLVEQPQMSSPSLRLLVKLLVNICPPYYALDLEMFNLLAAKIVNLSLEHGMAPESAYGFAALGIPVGSILGEHRTAHELASLSLALADRFRNKSQYSRSALLLGSSINHFVKPLASANAVFDSSYELGLGAGEVQFAGYALAHRTPILFYQGRHLRDLLVDIDRYLHFTERYRNYWAMDTMLGFRLLAARLTLQPGAAAGLDEETFLAGCRAHQNIQSLAMYLIGRMQELHLGGDIEGALACAREVEQYRGYIEGLGLVSVVQYHFWRALSHAARSAGAPEEERRLGREQLEISLTKLRGWAAACPENFAHMQALVEAELRRGSGDELEAIKLYGKAAAAAQAQGLIQDVALAHELAARLWLSRGDGIYARPHLQAARYHYDLWGAEQKVRLLDAAYAETLGGAPPEPGPLTVDTTTSTTTGRGDRLDAMALVRASQAISGEIHLGNLLSTLMRVVLEVSGARRGVIALAGQDGLRVEAEGSVEPPGVRSLRSVPVEEYAELPQHVIQYVARTSKRVILDDAAAGEEELAADPAAAARGIRSMLCAPILHHGSMIAILYLENRLTRGVFTPARAEVLEVLSAQAAISIENARVYASLERLVEHRTAELSTANASLRRSNEELDAFARTVAHDLKAPLSGLVGWAEYFEDAWREMTADEVREALDGIVQSGRRMVGIVDALLLLSRIRSQQVTAAPIAMAEIVAQALEQVRVQAARRGATISVADRWPAAKGYAPWLERVWVNYLSNGLKYGGDPPVLTLGGSLTADGMARFWVRDNGPGVPPEARAGLFAPFTRLDAGRAEGHGIGLSIVERIVERLGGRVGVEDAPGQGSVFFFELPAAG